MTLNNYITHPTGAGPDVLGPIWVLLWVWGQIYCWGPKSPLIVPLVIVTAKKKIKKKMCLLQLLALQNIYIYI